MNKNDVEKNVTAYWPDGLMPQLFVWLSLEMQKERASFLAGLGSGPANGQSELSTEEMGQEGSRPGGNERTGWNAPQ